MFVVCACGASNSAFNPRCNACGAIIEEDAGRTSSTSLLFDEGSVIRGYTLHELLGSGSLGRVFRATSPSGESVALKLLHPHMLGSGDARVRFLREANALKQVRHRYIGRFFDAFEHEGLPVLILEFVRGESLREYLDRSGRMPPAVACVVLEQLTEALGALHEAGWLHRDIKPENVILVRGAAGGPQEVRLLDFGLARSLQITTGGHTAEGMFVGSLAYSAPEQVLGEDVGPAADWWALGVLAYELLSSRRPFQGEQRTAIVRAIIGAPPEPLDRPGVDAPSHLARAVEALLVKDARARPTYEAIARSWR